MQLRRSIVAALLAAGSITSSAFVAPRAWAQDDAMTEMARQRFQEGVAFYDAGQYEKARAAFLQAWALKRHPAVLLNLAQSEVRSGHEAAAANHFSQYLREYSDATPIEKSEAEKGLAAAKAKVGEVTIVAESGAELYVDGEPVGRAPLPGPVYMMPGSHSVEARAGGATETATASATAGQATTVNVGAAAAPAGPPAGGVAPTPPPAETDVPVEDDEGTGFEVSTSDEREPFLEWYTDTPVAWILSGLAVASGGVGVAMAITARGKYDDADSIRNAILRQAVDENQSAPDANNLPFPVVGDPPQFERGPCAIVAEGNPGLTEETFQRFLNACGKFPKAKDQGDTRKTVAIGTFALAGAAAVGVGVYYLIDGKKEASSGERARKVRVAVAPAATPQFSGLSIVGSF